MFRPQQALYTSPHNALCRSLRPARAVCTAWLLVASPGVATAQPAPPQVVQGTDGTLHVVQTPAAAPAPVPPAAPAPVAPAAEQPPAAAPAPPPAPAVILNPDGSVSNQNFDLGGYYIPGCWGPAGADTCSFTVAVDGTYYVKMQAQASGQNYTFSVKQTC